MLEASHPLSLHLLLTREDDGTWIASTDEALAYGSGPAPLDAALDCLDDLIELASALLADEGAGRLGPGRAEELAGLRAWARGGEPRAIPGSLGAPRPAGLMPDYITALAERLRRRCDDPGGDLVLYRLYAVLALAKAPHVTDEDVHNAWSAWMAAMRPEHRSLVPFERLAPAVRELDRPYAEAINAVFAQGQPCARCGGSGQLDNRGRPYPPEVAATFGNDGAPCRDCAGTGMCTGGRHAG